MLSHIRTKSVELARIVENFHTLVFFYIIIYYFFIYNYFQMNLSTDKLTIYCNNQMMTTFDGYSGTNKFKLFNCANSLWHI